MFFIHELGEVDPYDCFNVELSQLMARNFIHKSLVKDFCYMVSSKTLKQSKSCKTVSNSN